MKSAMWRHADRKEVIVVSEERTALSLVAKGELCKQAARVHCTCCLPVSLTFLTLKAEAVYSFIIVEYIGKLNFNIF
jgi:hypothetical protein